MSVNKDESNLVRLGDYIELCDERNSDGKYTLDDVRGISILKKLIPTKADMLDVSLSPYKLLKPREFSYVTVTSRNGGKISLAINDSDETYLVSSSYLVFRTIDTKILLPEYLYILLSREEFDRLSRFNSWGSARETFDWSEFCRIQIPLPDTDIQQELVDTYNGLKALAEQNEALSKPLTEACQAYIVDCKKKHPEVELGGYIEEVKTINTARKCTFLRGVGNQGFIDPRQQRTNESLNKCTIFHKGDLVYNPSVLFAGAIALNSDFDEAICTEEYVVFHSKDAKILLPEFIFLWLKRKEMGRYFWFSNMDSVRNRIYFEDTCKIGIPLPPPEVQQAIVDIYNCAEEARKIANDAREKMKNLCPALVQRAMNG